MRQRIRAFDVSTFEPNVTRNDIYRLPEEKDESGWRGPADLLELDLTNNAAAVKYQGESPSAAPRQAVMGERGDHLP